MMEHCQKTKCHRFDVLLLFFIFLNLQSIQTSDDQLNLMIASIGNKCLVFFHHCKLLPLECQNSTASTSIRVGKKSLKKSPMSCSRWVTTAFSSGEWTTRTGPGGCGPKSRSCCGGRLTASAHRWPTSSPVTEQIGSLRASSDLSRLFSSSK